MARYIDLEELERRIKENVPIYGGGNTPYEVDLLEWFRDECIRQGYAMPTADVVEVVRCKDCKHWGGVTYGFVCRKFSGIDTKICMGADHYCSYGERNEE